MRGHELTLDGCRPEPLASYLKALGILRVVGDQADKAALARWDAHGFVLQSALDETALEDFFLHRYRPTPVVSPWNSSSGFGLEGAGELQVIEASTDDRLEGYRRAIGAARQVLARFSTKTEIVRACRSELPDECLPWMDAAVVLGPDGPAYPPLLGTGGNVGRLELSRNFHQRLLDVLAIPAKASKRTKPARSTEAWLRDALWDFGAAAGITTGSPGQFDPGATGGTNSAPNGKASSVLNPWDYVLMIEGSMLFAAGTARRLGVGSTGRAAAPFCADAAPVGYAGAADEANRGEVWLPLWERFVSLSEIRRLMAEGRVDWRGRHARTGLDFAKGVSTLGVDRGITAFARYVLAERFGQATVAVPAGRIAVHGATASRDDHRPSAAPLAELDPWLNRVRRASNAPAGVRQALRRVDLASFDVTRADPGEVPGALAKVLVETARLEAAIGRARTFRDGAGIGPVAGPTAQRWVPALLGDAVEAGLPGTYELRLAMALASAHDRADRGQTISASVRTMVHPIAYVGVRPVWKTTSLVEGFGVRPTVDVLAAAHARRAVSLLAARRSSRDRLQVDNVPGPRTGLPTRFTHGHGALVDIAALVAGLVDEARLDELLAACMLLDWREKVGVQWWTPGERGSSKVRAAAVSPSLAVLGPFYAAQPLTSGWTRTSAATEPLGLSGEGAPSSAERRVELLPEPEWVAKLAAGRAKPVLDDALLRLRIAGLDPVLHDGAEIPVDRRESARLAAALLCPLSKWSGQQLLRRICPPDPGSNAETTTEPEIAGPDNEETEEDDHAQS